MEYIYPLNIRSDIKEMRISNSAKIRLITELELERLFGMKKRKFDTNGNLTGWESIPGAVFPKEDIINHHLSNLSSVFESNYILETNNDEFIKIFNLALKLIAPGNAGCALGFNNETPATYFLSPNPYWKKGPSVQIDNKSLKKLKSLVRMLEKKLDSKKETVFELYLNSVSGEKITDEIRFLNLMIVLEILFIGQNQGEQSFRLALYISKVFQKYYKKNTSVVFQDFNGRDGFKGIRNEIVHSGKSKKLTQDKLMKLVEYTKFSLLLYLEKQTIFKDEELKGLILQ